MTGDTYEFYLSGGQVLKLEGVKSLTLTRLPDGTYSGYEVEWVPHMSPKMFSVKPQEIIAVYCGTPQ